MGASNTSIFNFAAPKNSTSLLSALSVGVLTWVALSLFKKWRKNSPYAHIPGPESSALGYLLDVHNPDGLKWHQELTKKYGHVVRLSGGRIMNDALYISDPAALHSILVKDVNQFLETLGGLFGIVHHGDGVASVSGAEHKHHRKLIDPVFNNRRMTQLMPVFYGVARQLQSSLVREVSGKPPGQVIDILDPLTKTALELIAQAGLGHTFNSFDPDSKEFREFYDAIASVLPLASGLVLFMPFFDWLRNMQPVWLRRFLADSLRYLPWSTPWKFKKAVDNLWPVYDKLYRAKMEAIEQGGIEALNNNPYGGVDLMTVMFKANYEAAQVDKLSDVSIVANIGSLVHGAQETTSTAMARFIDILSKNQELQERLRVETREAKSKLEDGQELNFSELHSLPLLDAVIREVFRLYPPVTFVWRQTAQDTIVPLTFPILDPNTGEEHKELFITKGSQVYVGMAAANTSEAIWGEDVMEFRPERWLGKSAGRQTAVDNTKMPSIYSNIMTFLGGQRACPGMRFALLEIKLVLSSLLQTFAFEPSGENVNWRMGITLTPSVEGKEKEGARVPVAVRLLD